VFHAASYLVGTGAFHWRYSSRRLELTGHLYLVQMLRIYGAVSPIIHKLSCLNKNRDNINVLKTF